MALPKQYVTPALREWIFAQADAGCLPQDIAGSMTASGWDAALAQVALEDALRSRWAERHAAAPPLPLPEPDLGGGASRLIAEGQAVDIVMTLRSPRVVVFGNLLSEAECDGLIDLARPRLARSETVDVATGASEVNVARTSDGMFFTRGEALLIARIEARIAALLNWPVERGEGVQVLRYGPGAQYLPHYDYFDPAQPGTPAVLKRGGQRVATVVMYLAAPESGGATTFPDAGLEVAPVRGSAVFFSYDRPHPATRTLHGGAPVLAGEKWVATKWLREGVFA